SHEKISIDISVQSACANHLLWAEKVQIFGLTDHSVRRVFFLFHELVCMREKLAAIKEHGLAPNVSFLSVSNFLCCLGKILEHSLPCNDLLNAATIQLS